MMLIVAKRKVNQYQFSYCIIIAIYNISDEILCRQLALIGEDRYMEKQTTVAVKYTIIVTFYL